MSQPISVCRERVPGSSRCGDEAPAAAYLGRVRPDPGVTEVLAPYRARGRAACAERVGEVARPLRRDGSGPSSLGRALARVLHEAYPHADAVVLNGGGIRRDLDVGPLGFCDLYETLPFGNAVAELDLTGSELALLVRLGVSGAHGFFQFDGLEVCYDVSRRARPEDDLDGDGRVAVWERDRLVSVHDAAGAPLDAERLYRVVVPSFLVFGGDDTAVLMDRVPAERVRIHYDRSVRDAVLERLRRRGLPLDDPGDGPRVRAVGVDLSCR